MREANKKPDVICNHDRKVALIYRRHLASSAHRLKKFCLHIKNRFESLPPLTSLSSFVLF